MAESRDAKAEKLRVFQITENEYFVESGQKLVCYRVNISNGSKFCACADFAISSPKDPDFVCKHILAARNGNGNVMRLFQPHTAKLEERFIKQIKGKDFVLYPGVLDLGHQEGIKRLEVEAIQYPTKENGQSAICKAILETTSGNVYIDYGDANPQNVNKEVAGHLLRVASTRGKARVLRDASNVGITALEELGGDLDDAVTDVQPGKDQKGDTRKSAPKKEPKPSEEKKEAPQETRKVTDISTKAQPEGSKPTGEKPKISEAQKKAIDSLAQRRGLSEDEVKELALKQFNCELDHITTAEASSFIRYLQQAA